MIYYVLYIKKIVCKVQLKRIETILDDNYVIDEDQDYVIKGSVLMELNSRFAEFYELTEKFKELLDNPVKIFDLVQTGHRLDQ